MPRSPKDNQEIRGARREEILRAASQVFSEKGFARTKISDIATAAGLSHGLVYHYFPSKEAVFEAIVDMMIAKINADMEMGTDLPPFDRLSAAIDRSRERTCHAGVDAGRVVSQAMMQGAVPDHLRDRLLDHMRAAHKRAADLIASAQADGSIDDSIEPSEMASTLICLLRGMSIRMLGMPDLPFPIPQTDTILRLLRPRPASEKTRRAPPRPARGAHVTRARKS